MSKTLKDRKNAQIEHEKKSTKQYKVKREKTIFKAHEIDIAVKKFDY